jgi:fibro-slime domain-containing protein
VNSTREAFVSKQKALVSLVFALSGCNVSSSLSSPVPPPVTNDQSAATDGGALEVDAAPQVVVTLDAGNVAPGEGAWDAGSADAGAAECGLIKVRVRDFTIAHPDFEHYTGGSEATPGLVQAQLGPDEKPVYALAAGSLVTTGPTEFADWYNDREGVNLATDLELQLTEDAQGTWVYDAQEFFPIDGQGFGNEGLDHNFHFTTEIHTSFTYGGGERFTFTGDDDVWVFINGKLAIDLGGVHTPLSSTVDLDTVATEFGIARGNSYHLDVFQAERHTVASHFRMETNIKCIEPVVLY